MSDDFEERPWALIALLPEEADPVNAASSEDIAHLTTIWFGEPGLEFDLQSIMGFLRSYAREATPITVPVRERGELGDDSADVAFLEPTEALTAFRDGMLEEPDVQAAYDAAEQYPEWTPHVTLGYPEAPAADDYAGEQITFDRIALWKGNDRWEYPMGQSLTAAALDLDEAEPEAVVEEDVDLEEEELVDDVPAEIPVHGVMAISGKRTGDGRMFARDGVSYGQLPAPLGYEFESSHGGDNSRVSVVGRIDEMWAHDVGEYVEHRFRGVIMPGKEYGNRAIEGLVDGSYTGLSVIVDDVVLDVTQEKADFVARMKADYEKGAEVAAEGEEPEEKDESKVPSDEELAAMADEWFGDGTMPLTTFAEARVRRFDQVPTGAYMEAWMALGDEFVEDRELTDEEEGALTACGCLDGLALEKLPVYDLTELSPEQLAAYDALAGDEAAQRAFLLEESPRAILASAYSNIELTDAQLATVRAAYGSAFAPGTKDGPGWITHPRATARIRRYWTHGKGAAKIAWGTPGDFNRCRAQLAKYVSNPDWLAGLCANMHKEVLGIWPAQHHGLIAAASRTAGPRLVLAASGGYGDVLPAAAFANPEFDALTPLTITEDGRVYGHLAQWGTCHIGIQGTCINPPFSHLDYRGFKIGTVETDEGDLRVGHLTYGTGHANERISAAAATAHYDKPSAVRAHVNIGEDSFGIWFAGVLRPGLSDDERREFKALGALSGDWRDVDGTGQLELVAATSVVSPGFPIIASSGGRQTALIAAGIVQRDVIAASAADGGQSYMDAADVAAIVRTAVQEYRAEEARAHRLEAAKPKLAQFRAERIRRAKARLTEEN